MIEQAPAEGGNPYDLKQQFDLFYPAGRGPLVVPVSRFVLRMDELKEGFNIHLPWDLEQPLEWNLARLNQVKARFYIDTGVPWAFRHSLSFKS